MSARDRLTIFPSRANHVLMKQRIVSANKGLNLLKRKRDALELKLREIIAELKRTQKKMRTIMKEAIFSIAKAKFLGTDFKPPSIINVERADVYMRIKNNKTVGVLLPTFELIVRPATSFPLTGLSRGGTQVEVVRAKFQDALKVLITVASLEFSAKVLHEAVIQNNMRVNGLDYVVIPRFVNTVNYIRDELDEFEREDFYRLKRSQANQRKKKEGFALTIKKKAEALMKALPASEDEPFHEDQEVRIRDIAEETPAAETAPQQTEQTDPAQHEAAPEQTEAAPEQTEATTEPAPEQNEPEPAPERPPDENEDAP